MTISALLCSNGAMAALQFHFDDRFSEAEQLKLQTWITEVADGVEELVGPYPFDVHIHFKRTSSKEPVPWANTMRGRKQGIEFRVDTRHSLEQFQRDWTAPHELSHLILPYVGRNHDWFAEGFASFMQHQVMYATGAWGLEEIVQRYQRRLDEGAAAYNYPDRPFVDVTQKLRAERRFRTLYWGGAVFFLRLDQQLKSKHDTRLIELLSTYLHCCRRNRDSLEQLIADFDRLVGAGVVSTELAAYRRAPGFPSYGKIKSSVVD